MNRLIVVSLIGLPAAGKSYLAHKLLDMSRRQLLQSSVVVISFDDYIDLDALADYKQQREALLGQIETLLLHLKESESNWENILSTHQLKLPPTAFHLNLTEHCVTLIVLDDNFYFRSMRQRVRAMCRNIHCQHFQIFVKSSLDDALQNNLRRSNLVPEAIIRKMHLKLEEPVNSRTIIYERSSADHALIEMLHDRIKDPERNEEQEDQRVTQIQSAIHELDIITRKELSSKIQSLRSAENFSAVCKSLNERRKMFLEDLRTKQLVSADIESLRAAFQLYLDEPAE